tara:strand:+ start:248 stop:409 length:162 start_codon:yes stop_codon:yes gene_type:complete
VILPQAGKQRFGTEAGINEPQSADSLQEAVGHAKKTPSATERATHALGFKFAE